MPVEHAASLGHLPLLDELAVITAVSVGVMVLFARFRLPTVTGLLFAGALLGPFGFKWVKSIQAIEVLAEVGVVLLLFSIGLEFSLQHLKNIFQKVALGGLLQVGLTTAATFGVAKAFGLPSDTALFLGFVFALSSTAIVLRALSERGELDAPHGRFVVGTLVLQDLCVVPMVLVVPLLGSSAPLADSLTDIGSALGTALFVVLGTLLAARMLVPHLLRGVTKTGNRELFLLTILALCIGTAWLTSLAGLSLALGAFLGGLVVADTEYGHRAMGDILPLRDAFVSLFFVSLGMLFDINVLMQQPLLVGGLFCGFLLGKGFLATLAAMVMRFPARAAWLAGVGLAQFGEFGFVLAKLGQANGVVEPALLSPLLTAGIGSMLVTPLLVRIAPHMRAGERLLAPLERVIGARGIDEAEEAKEALKGHVVIIGYGVTGKLTAQALTACGVRYVVLEANAANVRAARALGEPVYYADATSPEALGHAHAKDARAIVLVINDAQAAKRVVDTAKRVAPDVPLLMRTRYMGEKESLLALGATDVVAEEVEGGVEVLSRLLRWLEVPRNVIDQRVHDVRQTSQSTERKATLRRRSLGDVRALAMLKVENVLIGEQSAATGRSAAELQVRARTGALIIAVQREGALLQEPDPHSPFQAGDIVYLVGNNDSVVKAVELLNQMRAPTPVSS